MENGLSWTNGSNNVEGCLEAFKLVASSFNSSKEYKNNAKLVMTSGNNTVNTNCISSLPIKSSITFNEGYEGTSQQTIHPLLNLILDRHKDRLMLEQQPQLLIPMTNRQRTRGSMEVQLLISLLRTIGRQKGVSNSFYSMNHINLAAISSHSSNQLKVQTVTMPQIEYVAKMIGMTENKLKSGLKSRSTVQSSDDSQISQQIQSLCEFSKTSLFSRFHRLIDDQKRKSLRQTQIARHNKKLSIMSQPVSSNNLYKQRNSTVIKPTVVTLQELNQTILVNGLSFYSQVVGAEGGCFTSRKSFPKYPSRSPSVKCNKRDQQNSLSHTLAIKPSLNSIGLNLNTNIVNGLDFSVIGKLLGSTPKYVTLKAQIIKWGKQRQKWQRKINNSTNNEELTNTHREIAEADEESNDDSMDELTKGKDIVCQVKMNEEEQYEEQQEEYVEQRDQHTQVYHNIETQQCLYDHAFKLQTLVKESQQQVRPLEIKHLEYPIQETQSSNRIDRSNQDQTESTNYVSLTPKKSISNLNHFIPKLNTKRKLKFITVANALSATPTLSSEPSPSVKITNRISTVHPHKMTCREKVQVNLNEMTRALRQTHRQREDSHLKSISAGNNRTFAQPTMAPNHFNLSTIKNLLQSHYESIEMSLVGSNSLKNSPPSHSNLLMPLAPLSNGQSSSVLPLIRTLSRGFQHPLASQTCRPHAQSPRVPHVNNIGYFKNDKIIPNTARVNNDVELKDHMVKIKPNEFLNTNTIPQSNRNNQYLEGDLEDAYHSNRPILVKQKWRKRHLSERKVIKCP